MLLIGLFGIFIIAIIIVPLLIITQFLLSISCIELFVLLLILHWFSIIIAHISFKLIIVILPIIIIIIVISIPFIIVIQQHPKIIQYRLLFLLVHFTALCTVGNSWQVTCRYAIVYILPLGRWHLLLSLIKLFQSQ